ncbi:MAG UNVERIFIED_CONTAM: hypothetical protein LVR29_07875 [Microcystis novacekii LVE1205-3]|jgi:preprotein translocase subunit SecA
MDEIVTAYVNPELPAEEWDLEKLISKSQEFVYLLADITAKDIEEMSVNDIKMFLHEEVRKAYEIKERQVDSIRLV